jgi:hypothetical protein
MRNALRLTAHISGQAVVAVRHMCCGKRWRLIRTQPSAEMVLPLMDYTRRLFDPRRASGAAPGSSAAPPGR